jgi:hypothetical protein
LVGTDLSPAAGASLPSEGKTPENAGKFALEPLQSEAPVLTTSANPNERFSIRPRCSAGRVGTYHRFASEKRNRRIWR